MQESEKIYVFCGKVPQKNIRFLWLVDQSSKRILQRGDNAFEKRGKKRTKRKRFSEENNEVTIKFVDGEAKITGVDRLREGQLSPRNIKVIEAEVIWERNIKDE